MIKQKYCYWKDEDMWVGYLEDFPDYWTQGETEEALKENLIDIYKELTSGAIENVRRVNVSQPVPRHREINDRLARHIIKMLGDGRA